MIKKIKSDLLASVKNKKINVFVFFLVASFIILIFTKLSKQYTNTMVFNIEKINVPDANILLHDSTIVLALTLKTHGFKWLKYYVTKPKIKIDFSKDVYKRDSVFVWSKSKAFLNNTQFDKQVELLNIAPDTLMFNYGINQIKKVPVKLHSNIKFAPGYNMSNDYLLTPDSIQIIGPNSIVSAIKYIDTDSVILSNIRSDISQSIKLKLLKNQRDLKFSFTNIYLNVKVEKYTEGSLKVPVSVINVPKDINLKYFPKEVNVSYYVSLSDFNSIKINDFKVICDYNKTANNYSILIPELIRIPKSVKNTKISQQRIEYIITE